MRRRTKIAKQIAADNTNKRKLQNGEIMGKKCKQIKKQRKDLVKAKLKISKFRLVY